MLARRRRRSLALAAAPVAAALTVAAILAPHVAAGSATRTVKFRTAALACGDTVTVSTKLASDLIGCAGNGLTVAGSHVLLDLNGHLVTGQDAGVGIRVTGPNDVVQNGTVRGFGGGVIVDMPATGARVQGLRMNANDHDGIQVFAAHAVVTSSFAGGNTTVGVQVVGDNDQITNSWVRSNGSGIVVLGAAATLSGNRALSNTEEGIYVANEQPGTVVTSNVANANGINGIFDASVSGSALSKNVADFNTGAGIDANYQSIDGGGNTAKGNGKPHQCEDVVCS